MKVTINKKSINGVAGTGIGCATIFMVGAIFLFIAFLFLSPLLIPILLGILIGKIF